MARRARQPDELPALPDQWSSHQARRVRTAPRILRQRKPGVARRRGLNTLSAAALPVARVDRECDDGAHLSLAGGQKPGRSAEPLTQSEQTFGVIPGGTLQMRRFALDLDGWAQDASRIIRSEGRAAAPWLQRSSAQHEHPKISKGWSGGCTPETTDSGRSPCCLARKTWKVHS